MSLLEDIDAVHRKLAAGTIDQYHANLETSEILKKARNELLIGSRLVLERTHQVDTSNQQQTPVRQDANWDQIQPLSVLEPPINPNLRQAVNPPEPEPINNGHTKDWVLALAIQIKAGLDAFIETREEMNQQQGE